MRDLTVAIAARNAEGTIKRALESVRKAGEWPVLLVNDYSEDNTVQIALETYGDKLTIIEPPVRKNIGTVRQAGLQAIDTKYAMWLDADDEILSGRVEAMLGPILNQGADFSYGNCQLVDGETDALIKYLKVPDFLKEYGAYRRQLERNWIPSIGWPCFKTDVAKKIGYDTNLLHGEDYDILTCAIAKGAKVGFTDHDGHKYYDYPNSLSRNLDRSRSYLPQILQKHSYEQVSNLLSAVNIQGVDNLFCLVSNAIFQEDYPQALDFLEDIKKSLQSDYKTDPYGGGPDWMYGFYKGVSHLFLQKYAQAIEAFETANQIMPSAEVYNNLAVASFHVGRQEEALANLEKSFELKDRFYDADVNKNTGEFKRITTHPLRRENSRDHYTMEQNQ